MKERFIEVKAAKSKTASRRLVPISDNLAKWLARFEEKRGRVCPFDNTAKQIGWLVEEMDEAYALAVLQKAAARAARNDWSVEDILKAHRARVRTLEAQKQAGQVAESEEKPGFAKGKLGITFLPDGTSVKYQPNQWKKNALRHSFISYRVAETQDVAQVALEAGNSPQIIFQHYRELVRLKEAKRWFAITPETVKEIRAKAEREKAAKIVAFPAKAAA